MADKQSQAPASNSTFGQHDNAYVPHHISDHTKALQMSVRTENGWVNISDTLDQMNDHKDLYVVHDQVEKAQEDIVNAQSAADDAVNRADSAVKMAAVTSDAVVGLSDSVVEATSGASDAATKAQSALDNLAQAKNELQTSISKNSEAISLKADKTVVDKNQASIQSYAASVEALNSEVALKANKADIDKVNDTVKQNNASIEVLNGAIKSKVTESDVEGLLTKKDYATQTYTQDLVTQTSKTWGVNLSKLEGTVKDNQAANVKAMTDLQVSIDGIQGTVTDNEKQTKSKITELSDSISTKVSDALKNSSMITQLENDINLKVSKDDLISQINLEAGRTLIQSNKIYLDADSVVFGKDSKAFIPDAAITELNADKIKSGTIQSINVYGNDIVSFNKKKDQDDYGFVKINDGTLYLGETEKPDPTLIDTAEKISNIDVAHLTATPNGGVEAMGNKLVLSTPMAFTELEKLGPHESDVLEMWPTEKISITNGRTIGLYIRSQHTARNSTLKHPVDALFADNYLDEQNVDNDVRKNAGIYTGIVMNENWLALAGRKGVTVNLSGTDDDNYKENHFAIQKDDAITATWGDGADGDEIQQTAAGRIGLHASSGTMYFDRNDHGSWHDNLADFHIFGTLNVSNGQKNSLVKTSQGWTAIHAYETAEYYFGDIGENNTGANNKVIVGIDQLFGQTINTDVQYQVFVTPYSNAHVWVSQRLKDRFVVESDQPNAEFGWELKARRKGFEHTRLTNFN